MRNRIMAMLLWILFGVAWFSTTGGFARAQDFATNPPNSAGSAIFSPIGRNSLSQIESIDPVSGGLSLSIPLAQLPPGPGGFSAGLNLIYNSSIYDTVASFPSVTADDQFNYTPSSHGGGWNYGFQYTLWAQPRVAVTSGSFPNQSQCSVMNASEQNYWFKSFLTAPDGSNHLLTMVGTVDSLGTHPLISTDGSGNAYVSFDFSGNPNPYCGLNNSPFAGTKLIFATSDGSHIRVEANTQSQTWIAYLPDGTRVSGQIATEHPLPNSSAAMAVASDANQITDRNGNTLTLSASCIEGQACTQTLTDQFNRQITINYATDYGAGSYGAYSSWVDTVGWNGYNGAALTTSVTWNDYCIGDTTEANCQGQQYGINYYFATNFGSGATGKCPTFR